MKKSIFYPIAIVLSLFFLPVHELEAQAFEQGGLSISPGINIGGLGFYGNGSGLPVVLSGEYGILDFLGAGPYVGFVNYSFGSGASKYSYRFITFGVRGDFHYSALLEEVLDANLNSDKLDLYVALLLGYQTTSYSGPDGSIFRGAFNNRGNSGLAIGGRYYFSEKLGVFVEAGRILYGSLNLGLSLKI
ncbi:MAG: hypothetical protein AAF696_19895 [Bacteroidota bacterium]